MRNAKTTGLGSIRRLGFAAITIGGALASWLMPAPVLAKSCSPFGNQPATITGPPVIPSCTGGQLLGPWNDSDGSPRYSCLYESTNASPSNKLPLVVYLHPSLFTADSLEEDTNV